ncbi:MAG: hypothetical protein V1676_07640 [Candidatus Diapherotrites archaeon]
MENNKHMLLALALVFILAFLIRAAPMFTGSNICPDPYFHTRMSEEIVNNGSLPVYDELSNQGRWYSYAPLYHTTYAVLSIFTNLPVPFLINLFPVVYGTFGVLLVFVFARRIFGTKVGLFSALTLAVTGIHVVRTASYSRPDGLALLIVPAIIYLIYMRRFKVAALLSAAAVLLHPLSTAYLLTLMIALAVVLRVKKEPVQWKSYAAITLLTVFVFVAWLLTLHYPPNLYVSDISYTSAEMGDFSLIGIATYFTFAWIFIIIGILKMKREFFLATWFIYTLLFAVLGFRLAIFLSIPAAIIAGYGISYVAGKMENNMQLAIFYLMLFTLAFIPVAAELNNDGGKFLSDEERGGMLWLRENSDANATIASSWDRGHPLTYFARRKVLMDGYFEFAPNLQERLDAMNMLISTADCGKIKKTVDAFGIDYFFVHSSALNNLSYQNGILEADCDFMSLAYSSDKVRIFRYG